MKHQTGIVQGMTLVGLVFTLSILQGMYFHAALDFMNRRTIHLINQMMGSLLLHTHRLNDDLAMQTAIQSLSQGTGVLFATVLDNNRKVVAHSDPSLLGQDFNLNLKRSARSSYSILPLKESAQPWGYFLFALSRRPLSRKKIEEFGLLLGGDLILLLGVLWLWMHWRMRYERAMTQIQVLKQQSTNVESRNQELLEQHHNVMEISTQQIQDAIEYIPQAALYLDPAQRVLAINKTASSLLRAQDEKSLLKRSWQDVPLLENCGEALQRSLEVPGLKIDALARSPTPIELITLATPEKMPAGTWVFFR